MGAGYSFWWMVNQPPQNVYIYSVWRASKTKCSQFRDFHLNPCCIWRIHKSSEQTPPPFHHRIWPLTRGGLQRWTTMTAVWKNAFIWGQNTSKTTACWPWFFSRYACKWSLFSTVSDTKICNFALLAPKSQKYYKRNGFWRFWCHSKAMNLSFTMSLGTPSNSS